MNRIKITFIICSLFIFNMSRAQQIQINGGVGSYRMDVMKNWLELLSHAHGYPGLNLAITDNFPPYFNYGVNFYLNSFKDPTIGIGYNYYTTGARTTYEDYSGFLSIDIVTNGHAISMPVIYPLYKWNDLMDIKLYSDFEMVFSNVRYYGQQKILNEYSSFTGRYISNNFVITPCLMINKEFKHFGTMIRAGYALSFYGILKFKENREVLYYAGTHKAKTNWSGLRLGLSLYKSFNLIRKK